MFKKSMVLGLGLFALAGCGIQIYEYPEGLGYNYPTSTGSSTVAASPAPSASSSSQVSGNHNPLILSFTANPLNVVEPGQNVTFTVDVIDDDHDNLKYTWSTTGGTLSSTTGRLVSFMPPERAGVYTVMVSISDGKGGTAEGAQNIVVKSDGSSTLSQPVIANN